MKGFQRPPIHLLMLKTLIQCHTSSAKTSWIKGEVNVSEPKGTPKTLIPFSRV
jgi:hypothetical protein